MIIQLCVRCYPKVTVTFSTEKCIKPYIDFCTERVPVGCRKYFTVKKVVKYFTTEKTVKYLAVHKTVKYFTV